MKKKIIALFALTLSLFSAKAQNIGYINTETILNTIEAYTKAQNELTLLADKYKTSLEGEIADIDKLYREYQGTKSTLSAAQRQARENDIISREKLVKEKQELYFGEEGVLAKKSAQMLDPIKKLVQDAIDAVAIASGCSVVLDMAVTPGVVYKDSKADLTAKVIEYMNKK